ANQQTVDELGVTVAIGGVLQVAQQAQLLCARFGAEFGCKVAGVRDGGGDAFVCRRKSVIFHCAPRCEPVLGLSDPAMKTAQSQRCDLASLQKNGVGEQAAGAGFVGAAVQQGGRAAAVQVESVARADGRENRGEVGDGCAAGDDQEDA